MLENITKQNLNKTVWPKPDFLDKDRKWYLVDAKWKTLGRLAVDIAKKLMWKDKPYYTDFWDTGDYVVVINASGIKVTGNKLEDKIYYRHSGYKGHLKQIPLKRKLEKKPEEVIYLAVKWMLPKNKLRKKRLKRLKIFATTTDKYNHLSLEKLETYDS